MSDRPFELQSRDEEILAAIIDGTEYTDVPQSRIEYLLLELKAAIESGSSDSPIKYKGSKANIAALPTVSETPEGYMYTLISGGTTTSDFVEGSGHTIPDGENVVAVNVGTEENPVMKWDTLGGITDGLQPLIGDHGLDIKRIKWTPSAKCVVTSYDAIASNGLRDTDVIVVPRYNHSDTGYNFKIGHAYFYDLNSMEWTDMTPVDATPINGSNFPVSSDGVYDALAGKLDDKTTHTTINGIDVYVSSTQPTGDIAVGSVGIGW